MTIGGDPDELARLAAGGPGQAFTLEHAARLVERAADRHRARNRPTTVDAAPAAAGLRWLGQRLARLDRWVLSVATALRSADATSVRSRLLLFGADHPATAAVVGPHADPDDLPVRRLSADELDEIAAWPTLPGPWRDRVHRARVDRWSADVRDRIAAVPEDPGTGPLDRLARWIDRRLVDRISPIVDLHVSHTEGVARVRAEVAGARWLLAQPRLTVWSFTPGAPPGDPTLRIALGDPATATHLVVLLPGTGSGLHAPQEALAQARAVHEHARELGGDGTRVATVLDLYDAPVDLGRAADPAPGRAAGASTSAFLADLPAQPRRVTLVGHSYGAFAAAQALERPVDALVLLGAPGVGVVDRAALAGAGEVWAARAPADPIAAVADLDEHLAGLPERLRPADGPLADPLVALGPDPTDPEFGARRLATTAGPGDPRTSNRGHLDYLAPGTVAVDNVARVVLGRRPRARATRTTSRGVRRGTPPRRDRPASAGGG